MRPASEHSSQNGTIGFVDRTVCYMDLLGFSDAVILKSKDRSKINELADLLIKTEEIVKGYEGADLTFQSLSDSIFISTKNDSVENVHTLITCCQDLFIFFIKMGFLARGGMASGPCLISHSIVLGEPVVRAVKLEEQVAEFPRIVVGRSTIDLLRKNGLDSFVERHVVRGTDGPYWIDPFAAHFDLLLQADESWKTCSEEDKQSTFDLRRALIDDANTISEFISENLYSMQENKRVFSFHYWIYSRYKETVGSVRASIGSDLVVPDFRA